MTQQQKTMLIGAGMAAVSMVMFLAWCPPDACRALHIHTYAISTLEEYRQFLIDEPAFTASHRARAVRLHCADLRDDVVTALKTERLALGISQPTSSPSEQVLSGPVEAWHQGRLLHLSIPAPGNRQELGGWALRVRESLADRTDKDLSFLPRLFGGVILHVQKRQLPIVLFSDHPCV